MGLIVGVVSLECRCKILKGWEATPQNFCSSENFRVPLHSKHYKHMKHTHMCACAHTHIHTHTHTHTLTHSHSHSHSLTHTLTHSHTQTLTHSLTHSFTLTFSFLNLQGRAGSEYRKQLSIMHKIQYFYYRLTSLPSYLRPGLYKSAVREDPGGHISSIGGAGHCDEFYNKKWY